MIIWKDTVFHLQFYQEKATEIDLPNIPLKKVFLKQGIKSEWPLAHMVWLLFDLGMATYSLFFDLLKAGRILHNPT